jgi:hypothetical protein
LAKTQTTKKNVPITTALSPDHRGEGFLFTLQTESPHAPQSVPTNSSTFEDVLLLWELLSQDAVLAERALLSPADRQAARAAHSDYAVRWLEGLLAEARAADEEQHLRNGEQVARGTPTVYWTHPAEACWALAYFHSDESQRLDSPPPYFRSCELWPLDSHSVDFRLCGLRPADSQPLCSRSCGRLVDSQLPYFRACESPLVDSLRLCCRSSELRRLDSPPLCSRWLCMALLLCAPAPLRGR